MAEQIRAISPVSKGAAKIPSLRDLSSRANWSLRNDNNSLR
jgi:hypothetical protein